MSFIKKETFGKFLLRAADMLELMLVSGEVTLTTGRNRIIRDKHNDRLLLCSKDMAIVVVWHELNARWWEDTVGCTKGLETRAMIVEALTEMGALQTLTAINLAMARKWSRAVQYYYEYQDKFLGGSFIFIEDREIEVLKHELTEQLAKLQEVTGSRKDENVHQDALRHVAGLRIAGHCSDVLEKELFVGHGGLTGACPEKLDWAGLVRKYLPAGLPLLGAEKSAE